GGKVLLQQLHVDEKELDAHHHRLHTAHLAFDAKTMRAVVKRDELEKKHQEDQKLDEQRIKGLTKAAPQAAAAKPYRNVRNWNYVMGTKKLMGAFINGSFEVRGTPEEVSISGDAAAGGYVIGREIKLIKAHGSLSSAAKGASRASLHVYLLGQHVV